MPNAMLNLAWNMCEYMNSDKTIIDVLWLYTGIINNSFEFNVVEYILSQTGFI